MFIKVVPYVRDGAVAISQLVLWRVLGQHLLVVACVLWQSLSASGADPTYCTLTCVYYNHLGKTAYSGKTGSDFRSYTKCCVKFVAQARKLRVCVFKLRT